MMKKNKKLLALLLTATAGLTLAGCNLTPGTPSSSDTSTESSMTEVNELTLSATSLQLITGNSKALAASLVQNGVYVEEFEVVWSTSNASVATVENGVVKAISAGSATITATVGELTAICVVSVSDPVTLSISEDTLDLFEEETATLTVTASDGNEYNVVWSTSNASVATVENGVVTAVGEGTAIITASIDSTSVSCEVTVYENIVTMYLSQSSANIKVGEDLEIKAYMSDGSAPAIAWTSSNASVATVENGVVTAVGAGTTTITATVDDLSATCEITVTDSYEIIFSEIETDDLYLGDSVALNIVARKNGVEQDFSEVVISGEGFTVEGNVITLTQSGMLTVTAEYHGETMTRTVGCYQNVATKDDFLAIANNLSGWYKLTADLDFGHAQIKSFSSWNSNEVAGVAFTGIFDGQGHTISNFRTVYNEKWNSGDRDRSIFGHMKDGAIVRNVAFVGVETADRGQVVASYVEAEAGCLIENVYVEAYYQPKNSYGINMNANNPAAFFVGKLYAGNTIRNCVLNLDIYETVFNDINTFNSNTAGKAAFQSAFVGLNSGTIENCQVLYNAHPGQDLSFAYSNSGTITDSNVYATPADLWAATDLSGFDSEIWTVVENSIPHIGNLAADVTADVTAVEVPAGGSYQILATSAGKIAYVSLSEGVTVDANGLVTLGADAAPGSVATVKVYCVYDATKYVEIAITVGDKVEATAVESVSFDNIVTGANYVNEKELNVSVKVNDVAVDTYTVVSENENVVKVVDGKAVAVANGTTNILVKMGDATVCTIPVSITNCYVAITTVEEFEAIYNNQSGYYRLMNDIDFAGATHHAFGSWKYGHDMTQYAFSGIFDGNGYAIKNVVIGNDNRHDIEQADKSLFGIVHMGGIVKNLAVIGAEINSWGGVIASGVGATGTIENCFVEMNVSGTIKVNATSDIGPICWRAQAGSVIKDCIAIVNVAEDVDTTYVGAIVGMNLSKAIINCQAIVVNGQNMKTHTSEHASVKPGPVIDTAIYTSVADFYANVDLTKYTSNLWNFVEGQYPQMGTFTADISVSEDSLEIPVGTSKNVTVSSDLIYTATSDTEGVTFENGAISVAEGVAAGTTATITFTCAYDKTSTATITVTVANAVSATADVEAITEDIYVGETMNVNLGVEVKVNDEIVADGYEIKSSNTAVVTVENGVATLVGDGSASITVEKDGAILLTISVSVNAYHKITTTEEFLAMGTDGESMSKKYKLANDLDFGGAQIKAFSSWEAQNNDNSLRWTGIFDGNGYSVSNFTSMYNTMNGKYNGNCDRGIFGYMWDGSIVRNVSFLNVKTGDRCGVIANMVTSGAIVENVYVEARVTIDGMNTNKNNPAGVLAQKATGGSIVRNCIVSLTVDDGVKADVDSKAGGKTDRGWAFRAAAIGQIAGTVDNVQVIYTPFADQELPFCVSGTATNSEIHASLEDFYANVDLTKYDGNWHFAEGYVPYYGNMKPAELVITGENEVYQGSFVTLTAPKASTLALKEAIDGVTLSKGTLTVDVAVAEGTQITVVASSKYWADTYEFVVTVKANAYVLEMEKTDYSFAWANHEKESASNYSETLSYSVTLNGAAYEGAVTFVSANEAVAIVENGVLKAVGNGSTTIDVKVGDVVLGTINVASEVWTGISTVEEFESIFNNQSAKYKLLNDLDFQGATHNAFGSWKYGHDDPSLAFKGVFDGNGYAIRNVTIGVDNRHAAVQTDASIFGTVFGTVKNLAVTSAFVTNRGGVIASGIGNGGRVENCFVECVVLSVETAKYQNDFGAICFRAQAGSTVKDCIAVLHVLDDVPTTYLGALIGMNLSTAVNNCQAIVVSGQALKVHTSEHGTVKPGPVVDTAVYTSLADFYANADLTKYNDLWDFEEGYFPHFDNYVSEITVDEAVEVYAGLNKEVNISSTDSFFVTSDTEGVTFMDGFVYVDASVAAETVATLTFTSAYDKTATATITVTVKAMQIEAIARVESISNDRFILGTSATYDLGVVVNVNGEASTDYEIKSSNAAVVTVENGVATLVGGGSANITVEYQGAVILSIPVSVVAYIPVTTEAEFRAIGTNANTMAQNYMLMNDIDFKGATVNGFSSYASKDKVTFKGIFDGNGYALKNIVVGKPAGSNDYAIFGFMVGNSAVRNVSFLGTKFAERSAVVANWMEGNAIVENVFVEVEYTQTVGANANNAAGGIVAKMQAGTTLRNSVIVLTVKDGVVPSTTHGLVASVCNTAAVIDNCQAIYAGSDITKIAYSGATVTNSAKYASVEEFYANADLTKYDSNWKFEAGNMPYYGNTIAADISVSEAEVEVPAGMTKGVTVSSSVKYTIASDTEGVTFANGIITVADSVAAGTTATITFTSIYNKEVTATITVMVSAVQIEATTAVESINNNKVVLAVTPSVDLGATVKVNGVATDAFEIKSSNTDVVMVADGKVYFIGSGSANVTVEYEGSVLVTVPVSVVAYIPVYSAEDFENCGNTAEARKQNYMLMNDIDFADEAGNPTEFHAFTCWTSAFDANSKVTTGWSGIFDGNGYALKNIIPSTDNRNSKVSSDASIFGVVDAGGVIRNLKVFAHAQYRGGVVASLINNGNGTIENCYVEVTVASTLKDYNNNKQFGGIIFRSQNGGILQNNICIITLEKSEAGATIELAWASSSVHVGYGKSYNNFAVVVSGETMKPITVTNATTVNTNNVSFTSMDGFFAAEGGADYSTYNTSVWNIDAENKTIGLIAGCSYRA